MAEFGTPRRRDPRQAAGFITAQDPGKVTVQVSQDEVYVVPTALAEDTETAETHSHPLPSLVGRLALIQVDGDVAWLLAVR